MLIQQRTRMANQYRRERLIKEVWLNSEFKNNKADIYCLTAEELTVLWLEYHCQKGWTEERIGDRFTEITGLTISLAPQAFEIMDERGATVVNLARDGKHLFKLGNDFRRSGNIWGAYRIAHQGGRSYIIFKGRHTVRNLIRGTRYRLQSPQIVKLGIGTEGAKQAAKTAFVITVVVSATAKTLQWIFDERYGWTGLVPEVSTDIIKAAIASVAGYLAFSVAAAATSAVIIPIAVGIAVGLYVGGKLDGIRAFEDAEDSLALAMATHFAVLHKIHEETSRRIQHSRDAIYQYIYDQFDQIVVEPVVRSVNQRLRELERSIRRSIYPHIF